MRLTPANKVGGMRLRSCRIAGRGNRAKPQLFASTSHDNAKYTEHSSQLAQRLREHDLERLQPTKSKPFKRGMKPTHQGGGRLYQPGGGMRGN